MNTRPDPVQFADIEKAKTFWLEYKAGKKYGG
jgi:hypothetical protein